MKTLDNIDISNQREVEEQTEARVDLREYWRNAKGKGWEDQREVEITRLSEEINELARRFVKGKDYKPINHRL